LGSVCCFQAYRVTDRFGLHDCLNQEGALLSIKHCPNEFYHVLWISHRDQVNGRSWHRVMSDWEKSIKRCCLRSRDKTHMNTSTFAVPQNIGFQFLEETCRHSMYHTVNVANLASSRTKKTRFRHKIFPNFPAVPPSATVYPAIVGGKDQKVTSIVRCEFANQKAPPGDHVKSP
jgi:hypothetical protein